MVITNERNQTFGSFCGNHTGQVVYVSGYYAVVTFHSDSSVSGKGFRLEFSSVSGKGMFLMCCLANGRKKLARKKIYKWTKQKAYN